MRIPSLVVAATLAGRQIGSLLPSDFCSPICPSCRSDVADFAVNTSCVTKSAFMTDCGACQQCIITYKIEQGAAFKNADAFQAVMNRVLNLCANSSVSDQVIALQGQADRLNKIADNNIAIASASAAAANATALINTSAPTSSATLGASTDKGEEHLSKTWIIGPVVGSVLGLATVVVVIFCTKRRQARLPPLYPVDIKVEETDSDDSPQLSAALPAEPEPPRELENTAVYELPAVEPVGTELTTPMEDVVPKDWPLPITPLRAMFAMTELRDERQGEESPKHQTYYNP